MRSLQGKDEKKEEEEEEVEKVFSSLCSLFHRHPCFLLSLSLSLSIVDVYIGAKKERQRRGGGKKKKKSLNNYANARTVPHNTVRRWLAERKWTH